MCAFLLDSVSLCLLVDCVVSAWSAWSDCNVTCGGGSQSRNRTITTLSAFNGSACPSELAETLSCNTQACPTATQNETCTVSCPGQSFAFS